MKIIDNSALSASANPTSLETSHQTTASYQISHNGIGSSINVQPMNAPSDDQSDTLSQLLKTSTTTLTGRINVDGDVTEHTETSNGIINQKASDVHTPLDQPSLSFKAYQRAVENLPLTAYGCEDFNDPTQIDQANQLKKLHLQHIELRAEEISTLFSDASAIEGQGTWANDYYKITMLPVLHLFNHHFEQQGQGQVSCTFSADIRSPELAKLMNEDPSLRESLKQNLKALTSRQITPQSIKPLLTAGTDLSAWNDDEIEKLCQEVTNRPIADQFIESEDPNLPINDTDQVILRLVKAPDIKNASTDQAEDLDSSARWYIEASGPIKRCTFLETTLMQAVYKTFLVRVNNDREISREDFLAQRSAATVRAIDQVKAARLPLHYFAGRRSAGADFMGLQILLLSDVLNKKSSSNDQPLFAGMSSLAMHDYFKEKLPHVPIPKLSGTHAHELSMLAGSLFSMMDKQAGAPLSQVFSHLCYRDISSMSSNAPMLPDTLGEDAFFKAMEGLHHPLNPELPLTEIFNFVRQDSGDLKAFINKMNSTDYFPNKNVKVMASEIEKFKDMYTAAQLGYHAMGVGGAMGDSAKEDLRTVNFRNNDILGPNKNVSLAVKVREVRVGGNKTSISPMKVTDTLAPENPNNLLEMTTASGKKPKVAIDGQLQIQPYVDQLRHVRHLQSGPVASVDNRQKLLNEYYFKIMPALLETSTLLHHIEEKNAQLINQ